MAAQAGTLQSARQLRNSAKGNRVLIRTLLVILQTTTSAVVFSFVFLFGGEISPVFLVYALISATGLVAGRFSRRVLKTNSRLLQFLVALVSLFGALFALNYFSDGVLGISYLSIYHAEFDLIGTIQFSIGFLTMWLALAAWRKPKNHDTSEEPAAPTPRSFRSPEMQLESQAASAGVRVKTPRTRRGINWFSAQPSHSTNNSGNHQASAAARGREVISFKSSQQKQRRVSTIRTRRSTLLLNRKKPVKFVGAEDHRCPYCLEPVAYNDPRGVEICPICQTHHHADCWEVTGVCQVPHANG